MSDFLDLIELNSELEESGELRESQELRDDEELELFEFEQRRLLLDFFLH